MAHYVVDEKTMQELSNVLSNNGYELGIIAPLDRKVINDIKNDSGWGVYEVVLRKRNY